MSLAPNQNTRFIEAGGRNLGFDAPVGIDGPGHKVLLVHGSSMDRRIWNAVVDGLAIAGHTPVAVDAPEHGESSGPAFRSVDEGVAYVASLVGAFGWDRFILIGHSLGGAVTQRYAQTYPEQLEAVGLVSTAPHFFLSEELVTHWRADSAAYKQEEFDLVVAPGVAHDARERIVGIRDSLPPSGQDADLEACFRWDNREGDYLSIPLPVLLVTADHDMEMFQSYAKEWDAAIDDSTLVEIQGAGHSMLIERPAETAKAIVDWVNGI